MSGFDVDGALKAGYSEAEVAEHLASQAKFDAAKARESGYSDAEIISHLSGAPAQPSSPQPNEYAAPSYGAMMKEGAVNLAKGFLKGGPVGVALAGVNEGMNNLERVAKPAGAAATDALTNLGVPPELAAAHGYMTQVGLQAGPAVLGMSGKAKTVETAANAVRNATIREAREAGYVIPPTATGGGMFSKAVESVGGKAAIGQEASIRNQQITNKIARAEAGLAEDAPLTEGALAEARSALAAPYREVADVSPRAKQALEKLQDARLDSKDAWKKYNVAGGAAERREAIAADSKVDVLEKLIEREASFTGKAGLVDKLREARTAIAKNYDVERALNVGTGDVDAQVIGRLLDKRGEKGVTGGLGTVGRFAEAFKTFSREAPSGQSAPGVSKVTPYAAALLGIGGYGASEHYGMGPWGMAAAALPMLSGPARALALSKAMQRGVPSTTSGGSYGAGPIGALLSAMLAPQLPPALSPEGDGALYAPPPRGAPSGRLGGGSR